ncbi:hypothetical protein VNO77_22845 [Canavalia gladiata]|uniref:Uncharacterized protein n=1 Tax=Canavalia gladiata TaxID=3824 RepID=A0AAN9QEV1_CANGL
MHDVEGMNAVSKWCDTGGAQRYEGFAMNGEISLRMEIGVGRDAIWVPIRYKGLQMHRSKVTLTSGGPN